MEAGILSSRPPTLLFIRKLVLVGLGLCLGAGLLGPGDALAAASLSADATYAASGARERTTPSPIPPAAVSILDEVLRASGLDEPAKRASYTRAFAADLDKLKKHVGRHHSRYRTARRLHDALHKHSFKKYVASADGIDAILDRGEFNCVSAALYYGIVARAMGLDMRVVETPRHIFLQFESNGATIDIETTSRMGFDFRGDLERFRRITGAYAFAMSQNIERKPPYTRFDRYEPPLQPPVSLERATAFLWHNSAERALAHGEALRAALSLEEEYRAYPELAVRLDEFATSLARSFRFEYEAGRFDTAFRIAAIELRIFPKRTSSRDRILAAASKQIETACEAGNPAAAEGILDSVGSVIHVASDMTRLERETCPFIGAAAVRASDWDRANRMAFRYAAAEADKVEGARFSEWVEARELNSKNGAEICWEPRWAPRRAAYTDETATPKAHPYEGTETETASEVNAGSKSEDGPSKAPSKEDAAGQASASSKKVGAAEPAPFPGASAK